MKDKADVFIPSKYVIPTDFKVTNNEKTCILLDIGGFGFHWLP